ncbi:MAG: S8 family serine peptidase [Bacteroidales bacterium]|nr:S8 family serine peptidase [Bacteroidales bacterium]MCF8336924.1 S8 family serine peptidase [Bacteroidales bacterium]
MKQFIQYFLTLMIVVAGFNAFSQDNRIPGQMMIQVDINKYNPEGAITTLENDFADYDFDADYKKLSNRMKIWLSTYNTSKNGEKLLEDLRAHPAVKLAQFNHKLELRDTNDTIPNDTYFDDLWGLHNTGQTGGVEDADVDGPEAWSMTQGGFTSLGDTIVVAIVDGGMSLNHEDLEDNLWTNYNEIPDNGEDDDGNGYVDDVHGWDAYSSDGSIPGSSHGTHVGGTVSAKGGNDIGVTGVNWHAQLMPVAASSSIESTVVEGYSYVHDMRALYNETDGDTGAYVVATNASFGVNYGDPDDYPIWGSMYDSLGYVGVLSTGATTNIELNIDEVGDVPTAMESDYLISVTNTTDDDVKSSSAGYGRTTIDLGAPGTSIYSTTPGDDYGYKTGTSMATPHVTGAIALLFSHADSSMMEAYKENPDSIAYMIKEYILYNVDPLSSLEGTTVSGGRLNLNNSLMAMDTVPIGPQMTLSEDTVELSLPLMQNDTVQLSVSNTGAGAMNYHVVASDSAGWLSTDFDQSTLFGSESDTVDFYIEGDSLEDGTLTGEAYFVRDLHDEDTVTATITVDVGMTTEVNDPDGSSDVTLKVAPNPFKNFTRIKLNSKANIKGRVTLHNMTGSLIKTLFDGKLSGDEEWIWRANSRGGESVSPGIYFVRVVMNDQVHTRKLILQR